MSYPCSKIVGMNESSGDGAGARSLRAARVELSDRGLPVGAAAVDELCALEELSNAIAARRARVTASFVASQKADQVAHGVPADRVGRGVDTRREEEMGRTRNTLASAPV